MNRREFQTFGALGLAGTLTLPSLMTAMANDGNSSPIEWNPDAPLLNTGKPIRVQPILMYMEQLPREKTSWRSWGIVHNAQEAAEEAKRIQNDLARLQALAEFPIEILPLATVRTIEEANNVQKNDFDVVLLFPATGWGDLLQACFAQKPEQDTIIFARHQSGPMYYWYEALSTRYLKSRTDAEVAANSAKSHGPITLHDVVIDELTEVVWRLRALYGLKNFIGRRVIALGGAMGKYDDKAPAVAHDRYGLEIISIDYDDFERRLKAMMNDEKWQAKANAWTDQYLALPHTTLDTARPFVVNSFYLYVYFKELLQKYNTDTFTINSCMVQAIPIADTTACLTLSILNDEGYTAMCESDFVLVPAAMFVRQITSKPVFMHNSTFPHKGIVTCAHCTGPRRMDGVRYEPTRIVTHFESDFGAAPKVEMPVGQKVTILDPEFSNRRWLSFTGTVKSNPFYACCRSQQDVLIDGDWKKLLHETRDSHWVMVYGSYVDELEYASKKMGMDCVRLDS
jgi:hypothetical protein